MNVAKERTDGCAHADVVLLSSHELIRKYCCSDCGLVMMCRCDERVGRKWLGHQLGQAHDGRTGQRVPVAGGFVDRVCNRCRGRAEVPAPRAERYGSSSKIRRYYWRELHLTTMDRFGDWAAARDFKEYQRARRERPDDHKRIEAEVLDEIKTLHATTPLYVYAEKSQAEVLKATATAVIDIGGTYVAGAGRDRPLVVGTERVGPEEFVARYLRARGFQILRLESSPFHAIFGDLMWMWVQSPSDPMQQPRMFGRQLADGGPFEEVWTLFPEDFGTPAHAARRRQELEEHLAWLPHVLDELLWTFDYWLVASKELRLYLWAYTADAEERARKVVEVLGADWSINICRYLAESYWARFLGWPDLLVWNAEEFFLVEVKSRHDRLSEAQKAWLLDNHEHLGLPVRVVKIHREAVVELSSS